MDSKVHSNVNGFTVWLPYKVTIDNNFRSMASKDGVIRYVSKGYKRPYAALMDAIAWVRKDENK